jgi:transcriptional regulator with XRE-family HTH domain
MARGLRQKDLAEQMGYEQSYVSALEVGIKGPPTQEFLEKLVGVFSLSDVEAERIRRVANVSARKLTIPADADEQVYRLIHEMRQQKYKLLPSQVFMMLEILNLPYKMIEETKYLANEPTGKANMKQKEMEEYKM